jgi:hypothetical protein
LTVERAQVHFADQPTAWEVVGKPGSAGEDRRFHVSMVGVERRPRASGGTAVPERDLGHRSLKKLGNASPIKKKQTALNID